MTTIDYFNFKRISFTLNFTLIINIKPTELYIFYFEILHSKPFVSLRIKTSMILLGFWHVWRTSWKLMHLWKYIFFNLIIFKLSPIYCIVRNELLVMEPDISICFTQLPFLKKKRSWLCLRVESFLGTISQELCRLFSDAIDYCFFFVAKTLLTIVII